MAHATEVVSLPARLLRPLTHRIGHPSAGAYVIWTLVLADAALWLVARPAGQHGQSYYGQLAGAEAVLLLSIALVLISVLPFIERWFDGLDRAAVWHRRTAIAGCALLVPHVLFATGGGGATGVTLALIGAIGLAALAAWAVLPRWRFFVPRGLAQEIDRAWHGRGLAPVRWLAGGYERWRLLHRTTGIFVAAGFVHGVLDATPFDRAPVLRWSYLAVGGVGLAFYAYREVLAPYVLPSHDYAVVGVETLDRSTIEVVLRPLGRPLRFRPGQFAFVYLEGRDGWHRHPFTLTSAPHHGELRIAVKALGDYTTRLQGALESGMPAVVAGPHGTFDFTRGGRRQVWIAGGIGITPFMSWLRSLGGRLDHDVDLYYSVATADDAVFADEIREIEARLPTLRLHVVETDRLGRLTAERILDEVLASPAEVSVFMCGPRSMLRSLGAQFRRCGTPAGAIRFERFDWR